MRTPSKFRYPSVLCLPVLFLVVACGAQAPPELTSTSPADKSIDVPLNAKLSVFFDVPMSPLNASVFTLVHGTTPVVGTVVTAVGGSSATFTPDANLAVSTVYTASITTGAFSVAGAALAANRRWSFTTRSTSALGPARVELGAAGGFTVLAKSAISTVPPSVVSGDIGIGPAAASYLTGFSLVADATNVFSLSTQIVGKAFASDYAVPTPANLTTAVANMETAYTDAASRPTPDHLELASGNLGGLTLAPGLYKWTSAITIPTDVTLAGGANDTWIFQTTGDLSIDAAKQVILSGGAQAKNVVWQVAGRVTLGATSHFEGIVLCKTEVTLQTGATMNGRLLAQTQVALQQATLTQPAQ